MQKGFLYGLKQSVPIGIGYAPVALTFGILAIQNGLTVMESGLMSLLVFAGASQFIAIQLIGQGATAWIIGVTTLIVNLRHIVMSFSMLRFFPKIGLGKLAIIAHGITDESFVLSSNILQGISTPEERSKVAMGINFGAYFSWVLFSFVGAYIGNVLVINFSGFDFALLALFIVLTVSTVTKDNLPVYILAGFLAIILRLALPGKWYLLLSVIAAAALGSLLRMRKIENAVEEEKSYES